MVIVAVCAAIPYAVMAIDLSRLYGHISSKRGAILKIVLESLGKTTYERSINRLFDCGAGVFMAAMEGCHYCSKCGYTLAFSKPENGFFDKGTLVYRPTNRTQETCLVHGELHNKRFSCAWARVLMKDTPAEQVLNRRSSHELCFL
ncbi:hypothetical protein NQ317_010980 [Molorchus minor]|uniref:Small ribosomal subunit protein eS31 domain-containing protein n=1 Tax=Molorchus minor TaxID=1323400 RepID=A0ABQ9K2W6_9CUCU|nr:hypothetical protein NQ317_010980 [Molorchus minor]